MAGPSDFRKIKNFIAEQFYAIIVENVDDTDQNSQK